jgi:anti-sigma regulatory factor (Ser/Thr protein kinase)
MYAIGSADDEGRRAHTGDRPRFEVMLFPGVPRVVSAARHVLGDLLGENHPALDDAQVCQSELITNALRYTDSGQDGGQVRIEVEYDRKHTTVRVVDDGGSPTVPHVKDEPDESGRGLAIVEALAMTWGVRQIGVKTAVWFTI